MENYFDVLHETSLFAGIASDDLSAMLNCLSAKTLCVKKGKPVFLEGAPAGFIGVVLDGSIQMVHDDFYGNRSIISHHDQGELFAESFACANIETMPVSGYAVRDSKVMLLSCQKVLTVCSSACRFHNQLVKNLLRVVAQNNLDLNNKITFMSQKTTKEKLMSYLLSQAKYHGSPEFTIPFDRQALADFLGVERSAMSTELGKLQKAGILQSKGSWFHLYNDTQTNS